METLTEFKSRLGRMYALKLAQPENKDQSLELYNKANKRLVEAQKNKDNKALNNAISEIDNEWNSFLTIDEIKLVKENSG